MKRDRDRDRGRECVRERIRKSWKSEREGCIRGEIDSERKKKSQKKLFLFHLSHVCGYRTHRTQFQT